METSSFGAREILAVQLTSRGNGSFPPLFLDARITFHLSVLKNMNENFSLSLIAFELRNWSGGDGMRPVTSDLENFTL